MVDERPDWVCRVRPWTVTSILGPILTIGIDTGAVWITGPRNTILTATDIVARNGLLTRDRHGIAPVVETVVATRGCTSGIRRLSGSRMPLAERLATERELASPLPYVRRLR